MYTYQVCFCSSNSANLELKWDPAKGSQLHPRKWPNQENLFWLRLNQILLNEKSVVKQNMNYCITIFRVYNRKLGQPMILAKKGTFFEKKGHQTFYHPLFNPFLSVLHQNKALHNFHKRGQHPIPGSIKSLIFFCC